MRYRVPIISAVSEAWRQATAPERDVKPTSIGIVVSTYNHPQWLEKALWGFLEQDFREFPLEIVVADDGSTDETRELIDRYRSESGWDIKHVWHEDAGFRKCQILNRAILTSESEYLIFTDQDCIPRRDWVATHYRFAQKGFFLGGSNTWLPLDVSLAITREDVREQRVFDLAWLHSHGVRFGWHIPKLLQPGWRTILCDAMFHHHVTWHGANSSAWKSDLLAVNGLNERMNYRWDDRELGCRLENLGVCPKQLRYRLATVHLDHMRPYYDREKWMENRRVVAEVMRKRIVRTPYGIEKEEQQSGGDKP